MKFGYPPKLLTIDDSTAGSTLASLGVKDGEQILTSEKPEGSPATYAFASTGGSSTTTTTTSTHTPASTTATTTAAVATPATSAFGANSGSGGFGAFGSRSVLQASQPQQISASDSSPSAFQPVPRPTTNAFSGLTTVDVSYTPKTAAAPVPKPTASAITTAPKGSIESVRIRDQGLLVLRVSNSIPTLTSLHTHEFRRTLLTCPFFCAKLQEVEDDNSCLFNAIAYTLDPSMKSNVQGLRQIVVEAIDINPDAYPDVVLGYVFFLLC